MPFVQDQMFLRFQAGNGQYLCADWNRLDDRLMANRWNAGPWETHEVIEPTSEYGQTRTRDLSSGDQLALQACRSSNPQGPYGGDDRYWFSGNDFWCAEGGGGREVVVNRELLKNWETFTIEKPGGGVIANGDRVHLRASSGQYLCAEDGGGREVVADRAQAFAWETFTVTVVLQGHIGLAGAPLEGLRLLESDVAREWDLPVVGVNADGRLEVFVRGADGQLHHTWQVQPNGGWSGWSALPGVQVYGRPRVGRNRDGRLEVFVVASDGQIYHIWQRTPNGGWSSWSRLARFPYPRIILEPAFLTAVAANQDGRLEVFASGQGGHYHTWQLREGGWSGWNSFGRVSMVASNYDGRLEAFAFGGDRDVYNKWQFAPNGGWSGWTRLGDFPATSGTAGGIKAERNADGRLEIFANKGAYEGTVHNWQTSRGNGWADWGDAALLGTQTSHVAANGDGRLEVFGWWRAGLVSSAQVTPGGAWGPWRVLTGTYRWLETEEPDEPLLAAVARNADGRLELFFRTRRLITHFWQTAVGQW